LLHGVAARLHVPGHGCRRLCRGHLPPVHTRVLQGVALPRLRRRHSRTCRRAGSPPDGWLEETASGDLLDLCHRCSGDYRSSRPRWVLQQGRDPIPHVLGWSHPLVGSRFADLAFDCHLHVPPRLSRVSWTEPRCTECTECTWCTGSFGCPRCSFARCAAGYGRRTRASGGRGGSRWLCRRSTCLWRVESH